MLSVRNTDAELESREQEAIARHEEAGSIPPWRQRSQDGVGKGYHASVENLQSKKDGRRAEASPHKERARSMMDGDVISLPQTRDGPGTLDSTFTIEASNRFGALSDLIDKQAAEASSTANFTCDKMHCAGGHRQGRQETVRTTHSGPSPRPTNRVRGDGRHVALRYMPSGGGCVAEVLARTAGASTSGRRGT